ncbi:MAG: hypothetical protein AB7Q91_06370 [Phycisphaerales bacterium]
MRHAPNAPEFPIVLWVALLLGTLSAVPVTDASEDARVQEWFDQEWAAVARPLNLDEHRIEWQTEGPVALPSALSNGERDELKNRPDHPDRAALAMGTSGYLNVLWMRGTRHWRFNRSFESVWTDQAVTPRSPGWLLAPGTLTLRGDREDSPAAEWLAEERTFLPELSFLLDGGLRAHRAAGMIAEPVRLLAQSWTVDVVLPGIQAGTPAYRARFSGRWDESARRGFIDSFVIVESLLKPSSVGETVQIEGWSPRGGSGRWVASKATSSTAGGQIHRIISLRAFVREDQFTLAELTDPPSEGHPDPIRGDAGIKNIVDARSGVIRKHTQDGSFVEVPIPGDEPRHSSRTSRMYLGWLGAGTLIAAIIGAALFRRIASK